MATQNVDTGLPVAGFSIGQVVTAGTSGVEQVPPGEDAIDYVWTMCLPTIVHGVTWTGSSGALRAELVEILQVRLSPSGLFRHWGGEEGLGLLRPGAARDCADLCETLNLSTVCVLITVF